MTLRRLQIWVLVATCFAAACASASASAAAPRSQSPSVVARESTTVWLVPWDRESGMRTLRTRQRQIGRISPFWYELHSSGSGVVESPGSMDPEVLQIASDAGMVLLPTISNSFDTRRASRMLSTQASRTQHVAELVELVDIPEFDGLDVDYENLAEGERERFVSFVDELAGALHSRGKLLSVTVMASTRFGSTRYDRATDYRAIGEAADEVRVMAYDYSWACGTAGPVAPIDWVERVVTYVSSLVPASKLVLGVPLYGYDWPRAGCAKPRTWMETRSIQQRTNGLLSWMNRWQTSSMRYGRARLARTIWFEDAASTAAKARVARDHELRGVALWRIGGEDPSTWGSLRAALSAG